MPATYRNSDPYPAVTLPTFGVPNVDDVVSAFVNEPTATEARWLVLAADLSERTWRYQEPLDRVIGLRPSQAIANMVGIVTDSIALELGKAGAVPPDLVRRIEWSWWLAAAPAEA